MVDSGTGTLTVAADVNPNGSGDDGIGTLTIDSGAFVTSSNPSTNAITLRGAEMNIATGSNPAFVGERVLLNTYTTGTSAGLGR